jgi:hypothetical protein
MAFFVLSKIEAGRRVIDRVGFERDRASPPLSRPGQEGGRGLNLKSDLRLGRWRRKNSRFGQVRAHESLIALRGHWRMETTLNRIGAEVTTRRNYSSFLHIHCSGEHRQSGEHSTGPCRDRVRYQERGKVLDNLSKR